MTDYKKLVEALRILQDKNSLSYYKRQVCKDAADAIEELQQIAEHYEQSAKDWWQEAREYKIKSADGLTAEESKEIINRFKSIPCGQIEQLLKRGKWITIRLNNGGSYTGCSCCEAPIPTDTMLDYIPESESKYCYSCGAKMEVQDGANRGF